MILDSRALREGERLRGCSDLARLWWPYLVSQANGHGRLHIAYSLVLEYQMQAPPSEATFLDLIREYRQNWLLFLYLAPNGDPWGQWFLLRKTPYLTKADELSPAPPAAEYAAWLEEYQEVKRRRAAMQYGRLPGAAAVGAGGGGAAPAAPDLVAEVLRQCRAPWPATDEHIAARIVMSALAVFPGLTVAQVGQALRTAWRRNQESPGLFLTTLPAVLRTWRSSAPPPPPLLISAPPPEPDADAATIDQAVLDRYDRERIRRALLP